MHRPLALVGFALWLVVGPFFFGALGLGDRDEFALSSDLTVVPREEGPQDCGDEFVFIARDPVWDAVPPDEELRAPDETVFDPPLEASSGTAIGIGAGGSTVSAGGLGHFGTGKPSAFVSRRAGAGGRGGGGIGAGGGGGSGGCFGAGGRMGRGMFAPVDRVVPGALIVPDAKGVATFVFPLRSTAANAEASGWLASTRMIQTFANPLDRPLEAVYVMPLPTTAAVSGFEMTVGGRHIVGVVKPRAEAEKAYADALASGKTASLLTQERVNVFTQRVGNIAPGSQVDVVVRYFHPLVYDRGAFEYVFPMTVGPRYCPPSMDSADAASVSPPIAPAGTRSGREVAVHVAVDAGVDIESIESPSHEIDVRREGRTRAVVDLARRDEIANRDFVLRWRVAAKEVLPGCVAHRGGDGAGYFSAFLLPPLDPSARDTGPREVTFFIDASGSMSGVPFENVQTFVRRALGRMRGCDRFNIIRFGGAVDSFADAPVEATRDAVQRGVAWIDACRVGGGTEMLPAVRRFADMPTDGRWRRIVGFLTDGFVGNEDQILAAIRGSHGDANWFAFGVGSSVNRSFVEGVAAAGRGACEVVLPGESGAAERAADRCIERVESPVISDLRLEANGLPVTDFGIGVRRVLWEGEPICVVGRYTAAAEGDLLFRGTVNGREVEIPFRVVLPAYAPEREELAAVWARERIAEWTDDLLVATGEDRAALKSRIETTALDAQIVSAATSFVCVDESSFVAGPALSVAVPSEQPADTR